MRFKIKGHRRLEPPPAVSRGLGDTIARLTHATGLAQAINALHLPCVCPEMQEQLNNAFPYERTDPSKN